MNTCIYIVWLHILSIYSCIQMYTVVWEKFTIGYFRANIVHGKIFSSLGVATWQTFFNKKVFYSQTFVPLLTKLNITVHSVNVYLAQTQTHHKNWVYLQAWFKEALHIKTSICTRILISKDRLVVFTNSPSVTKDQAL